MLGIASIDGVIAPLHAAHVHVLDRGFQYGDAVFEALRAHRGKPDALDAHLERLERSCARLHIALDIERAAFRAEVERAIAALPAEHGYVRIMITRGDLPEGFPPTSTTAEVHARRIVIVRALDVASHVRFESGVRVVTRTVPVSPLWAGAKPTAYLNNLLAVGDAQRQGCDDALLLGAYGELLEGATSSVFLVKGGALYTPPLSLGILPGITRDRVLSLARELGLEARERLLHVGDVYRADEVFMTSAVRLIVGVVEVDGTVIGGGEPGPVTRRIGDAFRAQLDALWA